MRLHMRGVVFASGALAVALLPLPAGADALLATAPPICSGSMPRNPL